MTPAREPEPVAFASSDGASAHVFVAELADEMRVDGDDGHHLQRVRRVRVGERLTASDGLGRWCSCDVIRSERGSLVLRAVGPRVREPVLTPALAVAFALGKGAKPEQIVADLTELGVERIVPFRAARSVVRWEGERARSATARLRRVAREAAMQCRRSRLPQVEEPMTVPTLVTRGTIVLGAPDGVSATSLPLPTGGEWLVVVGAEGGLDAHELDDLMNRPGAVSVAVGPHVLRSETAAVALASVLAVRRTADDRPATLRST